MPLHPIERELVKLNEEIERLDTSPTVLNQVAFLLGREVDDDFRDVLGRALASVERTAQFPSYVEAARGNRRRAAALCGMAMGIQFAVACLRESGHLVEAGS